MPRKSGAQKRKAKQTSIQKDQHPVEKRLGELFSQAWADGIRKYEGVEEKAEFVRMIVESTLQVTRTWLILLSSSTWGSF